MGSEVPKPQTGVRARPEIILAVDPLIGEEIKRNRPTFTFEGDDFASFVPDKTFVNLSFHRGAAIYGSFPRLRGDGAPIRLVRFTHLGDVESARAELEDIVRAAISVGREDVPS